MKISSRPENEGMGSGPYSLNLTYEELEYIAALLYVTRLGTEVYKTAAFNLLNAIEDGCGPDFVETAAGSVCAAVSILDDDGEVTQEIDSDHFCIEV
jgi:hypothetical protein